MASLTYIGNALPRKQIDTLTPATVEIGDIFTATINGKSISVTATAGTVANVTGLMTTAWNNSIIPEFAKITAVDSTTTVTLTADTAGVPFTVTTSTTDGGGTNNQTFTQATTTTNSSPNDWNNIANWSTGAVPVDTNDVFFDGAVSNVSALYNLAQSSVQPASLNFINEWSGEIALPYINADDPDNVYYEYLSTELAIGPTEINVDCISPRIKIAAGTDQFLLQGRKTGSSQDGLPPFQIRGTHASNVMTVSGGHYGVAIIGTHTANIDTLNQHGGIVVGGPGATWETINKTSGSLSIASDPTTAVNESGDYIVRRR